MSKNNLRRTWLWGALIGSLLYAATAGAQVSTSTLATWSCTSGPCPWGPTSVGHAIAWPAAAQPVNQRLGYTVDAGVYLPASVANGTVIHVLSGVVGVFAGAPGAASHYYLGTIPSGETFTVSGIAPGEVLSVQGETSFTYELTLATPEIVGTPSQLLTWTCTGELCPWGTSSTAHAIVWPADKQPSATRLGYTVSQPAYLPAASANGVTIKILSGIATFYAGAPDAGSHTTLGALGEGQSMQVEGLPSNAVLSVQSESDFTYEVTFATPPAAEPEPEPQGTPSQFLTWNCTGSPCPWGSSTSAHAIAWPQDQQPTSARLGYTVSQPAYLPAAVANGTTIKIVSGIATVYAGAPDAGSHTTLGALGEGDSMQVEGLPSNVVLSVQSDSPFTYEVTFATPPPAEPEPEPQGTPSQFLTWNCTGSPCPWGSSTSAHAIAWPQDQQPTSSRLGYTVSQPAYLPAEVANGTTIKIVSGIATLYFGEPNATSHTVLGALGAGQSTEIEGLPSGTALSVQSDAAFTYEVTFAATPPPPPPPPPQGASSQFVTWNCTSGPCPWGQSTSGHAIVWPASANPLATRLGYTVSEPVYLAAGYANGATVTVTSGSASLYAGVPSAGSHRYLDTASSGQTVVVSGLQTGEVLSVQSEGEFTYAITLATPSEPEAPPEPPPGAIQSVNAVWRCNLPGCEAEDWVGPVINWPSWAAYSTNARQGDSSRTVYNPVTGEVLHPYMGSWAHGCHVKAETGTVLIIEWRRGADEWRSTFLEPGESHVIQLTAPEDGAMIESYDYAPPFSVTLTNCDPQPLP